MQYSPKLKKAIEEIREILLKHDIAGIVTLHAPGHAEYLNHITPSYSCCKIDPLKNQFELRAKKVHFSNDAERHNKLKDTANMLHLLTDVTAKNILPLIDASEQVDEFLGAEYFGGGNSESTTQNN